MTDRDTGHTERREPGGPDRRRRIRRLRALGNAAIVVAVILVLNFGALPAGVTLGQVIVAALALSAALGFARLTRRGLRRHARRRLTRSIAEYGGGLYGTVAVATWVYLQASDLYADIVAAGSVAAFVGGITVGWLIGEAVEAVVFGIQALIWPWYWFAGHGFVVASAVAVGVWTLDALRPRLLRWWSARRPAAATPAPAPRAGPASREPGRSAPCEEPRPGRDALAATERKP